MQKLQNELKINVSTTVMLQLIPRSLELYHPLTIGIIVFIIWR
jgi:hypothetical protein